MHRIGHNSKWIGLAIGRLLLSIMHSLPSPV